MSEEYFEDFDENWEEETEDEYVPEDVSDYDKSVVENSYRLMMKQIGDYDLLSFEEEQSLAQKSKAGDLAARNDLVAHNLRLVVSISRKYDSDETERSIITVISASVLFEAAPSIFSLLTGRIFSVR